MSEFFNLLRDLFASLFTGNVKSARLRREMKKVHRELSQNNPDFYRAHTTEVLPPFAEALHKWSQYVRVLQDLFDKTISNANSRMTELYRDHLVESRLEEKDRLRKADFSAAALKAKLDGAASFKQALRDIGLKFEHYLSLFKAPEFAACDEEITQLDRLAALSRFPYEKLLSFFDPGIATLDRAYKPKFVAVLARNLTQDLMDLYFSMAEIDLGKSVAENVVRLFQRLKKIPDAEEEDKIRKIVGLLDVLHKKYLSRHSLLCLIRLAGDDPHLSLPADGETHAFLELYKSKLLSRFELDREKLVREHSEREVTGDIDTLFKGTPLLEARGYTEALSRELQQESFQYFALLRPLQIVKSFIVLHYEKTIKEHLKQLVIDAFFEQKGFKDKFIALFHETQAAVEKISLLETTLCEKGEVSAAKITEYLAKHKNGKTVLASLNQLVETINGNVSRLIEEIVNNLSLFYSAFSEVLLDAKQHAPAIVSNIKVIGGEHNQEFMKQYHADHETMAVFLGIMKNFTVIRQPAARLELPLQHARGGR